MTRLSFHLSASVCEEETVHPTIDRLETLCRLAAAAFRPSIVRLIFDDPALSLFEVRAGTDLPETEAEREACARLRRSDFPSEFHHHASSAESNLETAGAVLRARAPVRMAHDVSIGSLCLFDTVPRRLRAAEARRLVDFAGLISEWPDLRPDESAETRTPYRQILAIADEIHVGTDADGVVRGRDNEPGPVGPTGSRSGRDAGMRICDLLPDLSPLRARERQIAHMAHHDGLTGLVNRGRFHSCLAECLGRLDRDGVPFALLYLDLDRLGVINETLGHRTGDAVLVEVATRLRGALGAEDVVGRLGGDEFAILQIGAASQPASSAALAQRLIEAVTVPTWVEGKLVDIGLSIGIAVAPTDGRDSQILLKRADLALSRAKADGRNTRRFYETVMDAAAEARRNVEIDLRGALSRGEFEVFYQPLVDAQTGCPTGAEALVRWRHPRNGLVSPDAFIALAEETGLIVQLGEWVLRTACRDAVAWPSDLGIAVNISAVQFRQARFVEVVMHALAETGLAPERLELEITETVLMQSLPQVVDALHLLRRLGVRVSLDDFGTGYSSLSYLRKFPFDKLKIDQSFVQDLADTATASIVQAIVALGRSLGMTVTAEGVETEHQHATVRDYGCTHLQGYLFGRPRAKDDFVREYLSGRNLHAA